VSILYIFAACVLDQSCSGCLSMGHKVVTLSNLTTCCVENLFDLDATFVSIVSDISKCPATEATPINTVSLILLVAICTFAVICACVYVKFKRVTSEINLIKVDENNMDPHDILEDDSNENGIQLYEISLEDEVV
ncbi:unnamed protein product, partial [Allacma fusca]